MKNNTFIHQQKIDESLCDAILEQFRNNSTNWEGVIGTPKRGEFVLDKTIKDSSDNFLNISPELFTRYNIELQKVVDEYVKKYPFCNEYAPWAIVQGINVQIYKPNGGYFTWHTERCSANPRSADRHLVFMTYLNDVTDGGETEFFHQELKVKPQKGLTLMWPADWTHTHRGVRSPTQEKAIVTGWFAFV